MGVAGGHGQVGHYVIEREIGRGGMGVVYLGTDPRLDRRVAIKSLHPEFAADESRLARFEQEARALAQLSHPNIAAVYDIGEHEGSPYIVMEHVEGQSLREAVAEPLDGERLLAWAVQLAGALSTAHERGVVHRDLKPENVIVGDDGVLRIVDFGLASLRRSERRIPDDAATVTRVTGELAVVGTPGYMSPEAAGGRSVDHRADQFALGVMLYELASGEAPFGRGSVLEVLASTLRDEPPPLDGVRPDLPRALGVIVERCMRKAPEARFDQTRALLEELRLAASGSLSPGRPACGSADPLPAPRTALVGRDDERASLGRMIVEQGIRLVTLTGPGGTGKTRLALQVGRDLEGHFGSRVRFVALSSISEPDLVAPQIARALGIRESRSALEEVIIELRGPSEPTLLILDNFEQVASAAPVVGELLAGVPTLSVMVTSREVLRLYGEHDFPVLPLAVPRGDETPVAEELERYPAVALFVERAREARSSFALTPENMGAVIELCARLDGLPLALELAAARVRTLSVPAILRRLQSRLGLLTSGARDLPDRQQTLRRTLDWSHELIDEDERTLFCRLGVFSGGLTLEGAEAVGDPFGRLSIDVVDGVSSLVDKSLLQRDDSGAEEPRFRMLETVREYALEKLERRSDARGVRKAHAAYCLVMAEQGASALKDAEDSRWLDAMAHEHENFGAALEWLTANGEIEWALRLALALFRYWERTERLTEARRRFAALIDHPGSRAHPKLRARAIFCASVLTAAQGDVQRAMQMQHETLELHRAVGDDRGAVISLCALAINAGQRGDHGAARSYCEESLELWERLGDDLGYARSLVNLANVAIMQGDYDEAHRMYEEAAERFATVGDAVGVAWTVNQRGDVALAREDLDVAERLYEDSLASFRGIDHPWGIAEAQADLGRVAARRGDWARAIGLYREALRVFASLHHKRGVVRLLEMLARGARGPGRAGRALELAGAAAALRERIGTPASSDDQALLDAHLAAARSAMTPAEAEQAWRKGWAMSFEQAIRLGLEE